MDNKSKKLSNTELDLIVEQAKLVLPAKLDLIESYIKRIPQQAINNFIIQNLNSIDAIAKNSYHSNKIEGSVMTLDDTVVILQGDLDKSILDKYSKHTIDEVKGFVLAYTYAQQWINNPILTEEMLLGIHASLMRFNDFYPGMYRTMGATIKGHEDYLKFVSPGKIPFEVRKFIQEYNFIKEMPILDAVNLKRDVINTHPFADGNGRTSRLILNWSLMSQGLPPIIIKESDKKRYKRAMNVSYMLKGERRGGFPLMDIICDRLIESYSNIDKGITKF